MGSKECGGFDLSGLSDEQLEILLPGLQAFTFPSRRIFEKTGKLVPITVSDLKAYSASLDQRGHGHIENGNERGHLLGRPVSSGARQAALGLFWLPTPEYPAGRIEVGIEAMADPPLAVEVLIAEAAHAIDYGALTGKQRAEINRLFEPIGHQHALDDRKEISPDEWFEGHDADYWSWPGERWMSLCMAAYAPDLPRPLETEQSWTHSYDASDIQAVLRICAEENQTQGGIFVSEDQQQDSGQEPVQDSGQPDANSQDDGTQVSQETPEQDSQLTTPQADQPAPVESERDGQGQETQPDGVTAEPGPSGQPAEGQVKPRYAEPEQSAPVQSGGAQDPVQREQELESERREHNDRTGGGEIRENEVQAARQEHNDRTGGGEVPGGREALDAQQSDSSDGDSSEQ